MSQKTRKRKINGTEICRTCLNELENDVEAYAVNAMIPGFKPIAEIIKDFTTVPVLMADSLPKNICSECYDNFLHMAEFRELIRASHLNLMLVNQEQALSNTSQLANKIPKMVHEEKNSILIQQVNSTCDMVYKEDKRILNDNEDSIGYEDAEEFTLTVQDITQADDEDCENTEDEENQNTTQDHEGNEIDGKEHIIIKEEDPNNIEYYEELEETEEIHYKEEVEDSEEETQVIQIVEEQDFDDEEGETFELQIDESGDDDNVFVKFVGDQTVRESSLTRINKLSEVITTYSCNQCNKVFNSPYLLITHKKVCTVNRNIPDRQPSNNSKFVHTKADPPKPKHSTNNPGARRFACGCCDATFSREVALIQHVKYHVAGVEYKCLFCTEAFPNNNLLKDHVRCNHCNFPCSVCHKGFTTAENLKLHKKFSHQPIMMEEKTCPFCEKTIRACFFDTHVLKHTT